MNQYFMIQKHLESFLVLQIYIYIIIIIIIIIYAINLGANKEDLSHVTNCIISLLPVYQNSFILKWFQHVMTLTYINSVV
jgi:hypothetical protein